MTRLKNGRTGTAAPGVISRNWKPYNMTSLQAWSRNSATVAQTNPQSRGVNLMRGLRRAHRSRPNNDCRGQGDAGSVLLLAESSSIAHIYRLPRDGTLPLR